MTNIRGTAMNNYTFADFLTDLAAYVCVGGAMMLMLFCFLNGGYA
jgi:hypothetical protein